MHLRGLEKVDSGFGVLSHVVQDNVYMVGRRGFIYTAPWISTQDTRPPSAAIILSLRGEQFTVVANGKKWLTRAVLIPSFLPRGYSAHNVPIVGFHAMPSAPHFSALSRLAKGGVVPLDRSLFSHLDVQLEKLYYGELSAPQAPEIFHSVMSISAGNLSEKINPSSNKIRIRELLNMAPEITLSQLAGEMKVSYFQASRLVPEILGMTLRDYRAWQKLQSVFDLLHSHRTITEIAHTTGFADSAHLSRTYRRWFGQPPSYSRNRNHVRIFQCW